MSVTTTPAILYRSTTNGATVGQPRRRYPLPQNSPIQFAAYAFDQDFEILVSSYPPAPKNTPSNAAGPVFPGLLDANAILTRLTPPASMGGGFGKFTASFCIVPASWDDFKTQGVTFPGWVNRVTSGLARPSPTRNVTVRLHYDYFVVDPAGILATAGVVDSGGSAIVTYPSMGKIPMIQRAYWLNTLSGTPELYSTVNDLVPAAGVTVGTTTYLPTYPTYEQYNTWIGNGNTALGSGTWSETNPPKWDKLTSGSNIATAGQYQFQDSTLKVHEGNIIERMTPYVIPQ